MNFRISKMYSLRISNKKFISPRAVLKLIDQYKFKIISSFHTRNVPHQAHQWIHKFLLNQSDMLIIQPLIGQYKTGEYKDSIIIKSNKVVSKTYKKGFSNPLFFIPKIWRSKRSSLACIS